MVSLMIFQARQAIDTSENPFEDPELRMAHRMSRNAGFAPSWIEERKDIDSEFENACSQLARVWLIKPRSAPLTKMEHEPVGRKG